MLYTFCCGNRTTSPEKKILSVFIIYGHGGDLGNVTNIILINVHFKKLKYKIMYKIVQNFL